MPYSNPIMKDSHNRPRYYKRDGTPIESLEEWGNLMEDSNYKIVKQTTIGKVLISTVWLGLDHNFLLKGPPMIFETMVFKGSLDGEQERYETEEQAKTGHEEMIKRVKGEPNANPPQAS